MRRAIEGLWWFRSGRGARFHVHVGVVRPDVYNLTLCGLRRIPSGAPVKDNGLPGVEGSDCLACCERVRRGWPAAFDTPPQSEPTET